MFTVDGMRRFHDWTHRCLSLLLDHLATIPVDEYVKEVPGFGFPTLRQQVIHIFNCEAFWIHALQGLPFIDLLQESCPALYDAMRLKEEVSAGTIAYLSGLTDGQLNGDTELHFSDGDTAVRTPAFIVHHILTHAFHHKGQVVAMCRVLGHPAPDTDLNRFE